MKYEELKQEVFKTLEDLLNDTTLKSHYATMMLKIRRRLYDKQKKEV